MEPQTKQTHWIIELEEDPETGDLVMPIPPALLNELGWQVGDTLDWVADDEGGYRLTRKSQ